MIMRWLREAGEFFSPGRRVAVWEWVVLGVTCLAGLFVRMAHLARPIQNDEAATVLEFVVVPVKTLLTSYSLNNHLLNSFLTKVSIHFFGLTETSVRFPVLVAGMLSIVMVALVGARLWSMRVGLLAAAMVAFSPFTIYYSVTARGYMLQTLCFLVAWLATAVYLEGLREQGKRSVGALVVACLGLWLGFVALLTMLYAALGIGVWLLLVTLMERRKFFLHDVAPYVIASVVGAVLTVLSYMGVFLTVGVRYFFDNPWSKPRVYQEFFQETYWPLLRFWESVMALYAPLPAWLLVVPAVIALVPLISREKGGVPSLLVITVATAVVMLIQRGVVPARAFVYMVPVLALGMAVGWMWLVEGLGSLVKRREAIAAWGCMTLVAIMLVLGIRNAPVTRTLEAGAEYTPGFVAAILVGKHVPEGAVVYSTKSLPMTTAQYYLRMHDRKWYRFTAPWDADAQTIPDMPSFWLLADTRYDATHALEEGLESLGLNPDEWEVEEKADHLGAGLYYITRREG
ncbi:MAG: glycosyltransferase family 39 protein [Candidatus Sumerlaeia bacterium]|nr:glycosyltransferase family 39 protein [Candidatus Sumerlaeia bacterium]